MESAPATAPVDRAGPVRPRTAGRGPDCVSPGRDARPCLDHQKGALLGRDGSRARPPYLYQVADRDRPPHRVADPAWAEEARGGAIVPGDLSVSLPLPSAPAALAPAPAPAQLPRLTGSVCVRTSFPPSEAPLAVCSRPNSELGFGQLCSRWSGWGSGPREPGRAPSNHPRCAELLRYAAAAPDPNSRLGHMRGQGRPACGWPLLGR